MFQHYIIKTSLLPIYCAAKSSVWVAPVRKILFSLALLLVSLGSYAQERLPKVVLKDMEGRTVQTDTIANNGKPLLLAFFATWCKPCNRELKAIAELYDEWQQETGVRIIAVSVDQAQNINKVKPLVDQNGWRYDVLLDPNSELRHALGIQLIPYTVLLDGQGNIVYRHNGYTDGAELELYEKIKEIASK